MKKELEDLVLKFQPGLQTILNNGFYEADEIVLGTPCTIHVLTKREIADSSLRAGQMAGNDLITRQHFLNVWLMSHAVSVVGGIRFQDITEAFDFFSTMSDVMFEQWLKKYNELVPKGDLQVKALVTAVKNSPGAQMDGDSGSDLSTADPRNATGGSAVPEMTTSRRRSR